MAKRSHKSRGSKGSKTLVKCNNSRKKARNNHLTKDKFARSQSPSSSDDVHEGQLRSMASDDEAELDEEEMEEDEEVLVHKEPSMYDNLLKKLGTDNDWSTDMNKDRESDNEDCNVSEDDDRDSELSHKYNDEDDLEGPDNDYGRSGDRGTKLTEHSEEEEDSEASDALADDDVSDLETELGDNNRGSVASASQSHSSFSLHVGHKLSKDDIDNLLKRKWKYRWDVRAFDMKTCKWMGTGECSLKDIDATGAAGYGLKLKLYKNWLEIYHAAGGNDFHSSRQRIFFSLCNSYRDILHHNKRPFYLRGSDEDSSSMDAYIMHVLNHLFRTRDLITKNDTKLARHQETRKEEVLTSDSFLDHGFTRPKVLILLPLASIALRLVRRLIQLIPSTNKVNVEYMDRFYNEFGADVEEGEVENASSKNNFDPQIAKLQKPSKPHDYQALFGANNNDHFMIGIKFTRKSIKLYSDFYSSDMIVASPLGLITKIGEAEVDKEKDVDYLSSIEILIIDHADVVTMQNWSHVNTVMEHLNRLPSKQHGTDIMRIRQWYLNEHAQFYRQTIVLSSYLNPDINALWNHNCVNFEGKLRLSCEYKGVLSKVILQVRQIYKRFDSDSIMEADDARLQYFVQKVFPKIKDSIQGGIMLFISSYFEFVRLRNFLKSQNASFCLLGEYTKQSDISRARNWFIQGQRKIMLYTERAHFYHRYKIRGIQNLIIYSLPERKEFYPEVINMLEGSQNMSCTVLFSRFDQFRLERIVGSSAAKRMVSSDKGLFVFC